MKSLRVALIRTLIVVVVVIVVRGLGAGFSMEDVLRRLLQLGLPMFLGLLAFAQFGPRRETRAERALYPTLYGWLLWSLMDWMWEISAPTLVGGLFDHGIVIPLGFVIAYPVLWCLDLVWRPAARRGKSKASMLR